MLDEEIVVGEESFDEKDVGGGECLRRRMFKVENA